MLNVVYEFTELSKYIPDGKLDPLTFQTVMDAANAKYYLAKVHMDWHQFLDMYSYLHLFFRMCWLKYHLKWLSTWIGTDSDLAFQMCKQRYECNKWDFDSLLLLLHHTVVTQWMIILLICWHFSTIFPFHDAIWKSNFPLFIKTYKGISGSTFFSPPPWDDGWKEETPEELKNTNRKQKKY